MCFVMGLFFFFFNDVVDWTWDLELARQVLYHLSHGPQSKIIINSSNKY
jgi:hypothetical protein